MILVVNILGLGIALTTFLLVVYAIIYFLMFITRRFNNHEKLNDNMLKILYIMTMLPFIVSGLYILSLLFVINYNITSTIMMIIFGLFLIIYPLFKGIRRIKDIDYFGGV